MPVHVGSAALEAAYVGSQALARIYRGSDLVWDAATASPDLYNEGANEDAWVHGIATDGGFISRSKEADHLFIEVSRHDTTGGQAARVTDEPVSLDGISEVEVEWQLEGASSSQNRCRLIVSSNKTGSSAQFDAFVEVQSPFSRKTDVIDVSALSSTLYVRAHAIDNNVAGPTTSRLRVYRVTLTP